MDVSEPEERWEEQTRAAYRELQEWRKEHPRATLAEMERHVEEQLHRLRRGLLEDLASGAAQPGEAGSQCPACGGPRESRGQHERVLILPGDEQLHLRRTYAVCRRCGVGAFPADDELALTPGMFSPRLHEAVVRLSTSLPFAQAAREVGWLLGVSVSKKTACRLTEQAGATNVVLEETAVARLEREQPVPPRGPRLQQVSADGAMVPLVHGEWAEVKTVAIGTIGSSRGAAAREPRTTDISYFSRLADHDTFSRLALLELHRRGTETAGVVVGVMDGSDWLQKFLDLHRPTAVRILDFPHAVQHLAAAAQAAFGIGTPAAADWLSQQRTDLRHRTPRSVLAAVRALATTAAADPAAAMAARDATLRYLTKRRRQIAYASFQKKGYPIGSGMIESANKLVVEARLKGSGMHWARPHVDPLLSLRTSLCSDRWDETWPAITAAQRSEARARAERRRRARHDAGAPDHAEKLDPKLPAPLPATLPSTPPSVRHRTAPTIVDGRPTAEHPWKRYPLTRRSLPAGAKL